MVSRLDQGEPWIPDLLSIKEKDVPKGSSTGDRPLPFRRERNSWMEQDHWVFDDEKVVGVHWGYEETRTLLAILKLNFMKLSKTATGTAKCMGL